MNQFRDQKEGGVSAPSSGSARSLRVLVGCEFSGVVRRAFNALGHDAWSCDLLPAEDGSNRHITGDIRDHLNDGWDLLAVMHPPCTRLCNSGVRWLATPPPGKTVEQMQAELEEGAALFSACWNAPIERVAVENPVMHRHAKALIENYQPAAQTVQPWWFGDPAFKGTGLYLRGLPALVPTNRLAPPRSGTPEHKAWSAVHRAPSPAHTLDRIDNDKGYEPGNVRWATRAQQSRNTRRTVLVDGLALVDFCSANGLSYEAVQARIRRGYPLSAAISPLVGHAFRAAFQGKTNVR